MRKNNLFVIALLGYCVLALSACEKVEIKNTSSTGKNIICFGDSITAGYGAGAGEDYPTALAKLVSMPVINAGVDSDTTKDGLLRLDDEALKRDPFLVIIEFCGNDFIKGFPREVTLKNLEEMIDRCQAQGVMVALVDISAGMFFKEYRWAYRSLARKKQAIFVPAVLDMILTNPSMKSDFLHPNAEGYKEVARRIYRQIKPYLKESH